MVIWITGISGSGKSILESIFLKNLKKHKNTIFFDGDEFKNLSRRCKIYIKRQK